jgi:hypothetical protein
LAELFEGGLEVFDDFLGEDVEISNITPDYLVFSASSDIIAFPEFRKRGSDAGVEYQISRPTPARLREKLDLKDCTE